jgi:hypothetical protein
MRSQSLKKIFLYCSRIHFIEHLELKLCRASDYAHVIVPVSAIGAKSNERVYDLHRDVSTWLTLQGWERHVVAHRSVQKHLSSPSYSALYNITCRYG